MFFLETKQKQQFSMREMFNVFAKGKPTILEGAI